MPHPLILVFTLLLGGTLDDRPALADREILASDALTALS